MAMTAEEVRKLIPEKVTQIVEEIINECAKQSKKGLFSYKTYKYEFCIYSESTELQKEIIKDLNSLGFNAVHQCVEKKDEKDCYLFVSWK